MIVTATGVIGFLLYKKNNQRSTISLSSDINTEFSDINSNNDLSDPSFSLCKNSLIELPKGYIIQHVFSDAAYFYFYGHHRDKNKILAYNKKTRHVDEIYFLFTL